MKASIEVKLKPFNVPNFVLVDEPLKERQDGFSEGRKYALSELDAETLEALCWEFKQEVFAKAGKQSPTNLLQT